MAVTTFEALGAEYAQLWATVAMRPDKAADIDATARKILAKKIFYQAVELQTHVPWFVVGVIHAMESGCDFRTHLHNGDPLIARTKLVPAGRPKAGKPPFTWQESAIDALTMKNLQTITEWNVERICYELERYNGFGYRNYHPETLSPYLWSGSTHYKRGKYVADGKWSSTAVSGQSGAIPILKQLMVLDVSITIPGYSLDEEVPPAPELPIIAANLEFPKTEEVAAPPVPPAPPPAAPAQPAGFMQAAYESRSVWALLMGAGSWIAAQFKDAVDAALDWGGWAMGILPNLVTEVKGTLTNSEMVFSWLRLSWPKAAFYVTTACILVVLVRHVNDKLKLAAKT